jgi:cytochrome c oxidase subunit 1/cytochrome c oxidase subunit I+III
MSQTATAVVAGEHAEHHEPTGLWSWIATVDHKRIGLLYLGTALFFLLTGGVEALMMRIQLSRPNNDFISPELFNQLFTMHGTTMIFMVVMPTLIGFANYFVPLMIGARDMAYPRLNAMAYWFLPFGGLLMHFSWLAGGAPSAGWFSYAPLSETPFNSTHGVDYWALGLFVMGIGSISTSINIIATIVACRPPGMTLFRMPLFVWMTLVNSFLITLAMPILNASLVMLFVDRLFAAHFFLPEHGGSAVIWQHFFWAFGHPEVYILVLPAFGMVSEVIPVFARRPIFGYGTMVGSVITIAVLSFGVWAHHMFTVGLGNAADAFFAASTMLIAVPTGIKIFNWSATLWGGSIKLNTAMLFCMAFLIEFTIGGLSGITFAVVPIDWQMNASYYLVAHFHYVIFGGTYFAMMAGIYYWFPKMTGRILSERLGKWHFWATVIGFNMTFFVQHFLGFMGMPRRVYTYPDLPGWATLNMISTIGAFILGTSAFLLVWNVIMTSRRPANAGNNPWNAWTLEWMTTSPPPEHNFDYIPPVHGRRPLWDLEHPELPDDAAAQKENFWDPIFDKFKVGMACFIASESFFFLMLVIGFVFYNTSLHMGQFNAHTLDIPKSSIFTVALLGSSVTLHIAEHYMEAKKRAAFLGWFIFTIALGLVFLIGQGGEYYHLFTTGVTINANLFSSSFFILTGFHGFHVFVGLILLMIVLIFAFVGDYNSGKGEIVKTIGWYWHFVDAVWIVVFSTVYLIGPHL